MVVYCWVQGCHNTGSSLVKRSFHYIPKVREYEGEQTKELSAERRIVWLANINRKDLPSKTSRICSDHFISGKPADLYDKSNPDWAPTLKLSDTLTPTKSAKKTLVAKSGMKRYQRVLERSKTKEKHQVARALLDLSTSSFNDTIPEFTAIPISNEEIIAEPVCEFMRSSEIQEDVMEMESTSTSVIESQVNSEVQRLLTENMFLKEQISNLKFNEKSLEGQDEKVKYYTGLPSYFLLNTAMHLHGCKPPPDRPYNHSGLNPQLRQVRK